MAYRPSYTKGSWKVICDICGREYLSYELRKRWDGFLVCKDDWEPRHPQDFVRGVADFQAPPYTRPESQDTFIGVCTPDGMSCIVDYAVVECCIVDYIAYWFDFTINPPPCNALYYFVDTTIPAGEIVWACQTVVVDANLTVDGILGVSN